MQTRMETFDGANFSPVTDQTFQTPGITSTGTTLQRIDAAVTHNFEVESARIRADTGAWTVRVRYNTAESGTTATIFTASLTYFEIDE